MNTAHAVMAGDPAAAPSTRVGASESKHNGAKVVPFPGARVDHTRDPLTNKGDTTYHLSINVYTNPRGNRETECPRNYLPIEDIYEIALALGRQVTDEEVRLMVCRDGNIQKCSISHREFQPVRWIVVTDKFLDTIRAQGKIVTDGAMWRGCFFPDQDRNKTNYVAIAGVPRSWNRDGTLRAHWSPLYRLCEKINASGVTFAQCAAIIAERQRQQEALAAEFDAQEARMDQTLQNLFGKKPAPHRLDRRQFVKPRNQSD